MPLGSNTAPLGQLIALDLLFPPIGAGIWWMMSRALASVFQGGNVSERSKKLLNKGFWVVLSAAYLLMFGITVFACLR